MRKMSSANKRMPGVCMQASQQRITKEPGRNEREGDARWRRAIGYRKSDSSREAERKSVKLCAQKSRGK